MCTGMNANEFLNQLHTYDRVVSEYKNTEAPISLHELQLLNMLRKKDMPLVELSTKRGVYPQGISRMCARLAIRGLVNIDTPKRDKRKKIVSITEQGHDKAIEANDILSGILT